jgi:spermidine/putrescine transport system permease protein
MARIAAAPDPEASAARLRRLLLAPAWGWLVLFSFLPLTLVLVISLLQPGAPVAWRFTLDNYARLADALLLRIALRSLGMAAATTACCLAVGYPLAYFLARRRPAVRRALYLLTIVPLWANSLVLTYAWMVLLRVDGVFDRLAHLLGWLDPQASLHWLYTPGAVLVGLVYWYLPFMVYPLYAALEKLDWTLLDAAEDLGATRLVALVRVVLPLSWPGIAAGSLLVFIPALGNFVVPQLLGGAKWALIGNVIQERFLSQPQDWPLGSALALLLMLVIAAGLWLYFRYAREGSALGSAV